MHFDDYNFRGWHGAAVACQEAEKKAHVQIRTGTGTRHYEYGQEIPEERAMTIKPAMKRKPKVTRRGRGAKGKTGKRIPRGYYIEKYKHLRPGDFITVETHADYEAVRRVMTQLGHQVTRQTVKQNGGKVYNIHVLHGTEEV